MSKMLTMLALAGDKGAAVYAAADELRGALLFAVRDGNTRNIADTLSALRDGDKLAGRPAAVTKDGTPRASKQGRILLAMIHAANAAESARAAHMAQFPSYKGKPSTEKTDAASLAVSPIIETFEAEASAALEPASKPANKPEGPTKAELVEQVTALSAELAKTRAERDALQEAATMIALRDERIAALEAENEAITAELAALRAKAPTAATKPAKGLKRAA